MAKLMLIKPSEEYIEEIRDYRQEFIDDGGHFNGDSGLGKYENIAEWIQRCRNMESRDFAEPLGYVEGEQFMLLREGSIRILGMISFRHYLNDHLAEYNGHIGYGVRPSERRKGYATAMLRLCLEKCPAQGLNKVLITCNADNEASRRTIIACGGVFERIAIEWDGGKVERYWIEEFFKQNTK
jgi:predicted acetyltransferase